MLAAIVVTGYAIAPRSGDWPPSHPWSGLTLLILAVTEYQAGSRADHRFRTVQLGAEVLALGGATLWLISAVSATR